MLNLEKNKYYLLACSFGPDSMALFDMLLKEGYKFAVAHVNYHLRAESSDEEINLRNYCLTHGVGIYVKSVTENLGESNLEKKCRDIRYNFFIDLVKQKGFDALLVAHQEDDLIETYLMQKQRKNLVLFYGIQPETTLFGVKILRPLLDYSKASLFDYCNNHNIPYAIDKTNLVPIYTRNKIRIDVVSKLSKEKRTEILEKIDEENYELRKILDKIDKTPSKVGDLLCLNDKEFAYYINGFINKDEYVCNVTYKQSKEVRQILKSDAPNISLLLKKGEYVLTKSYDDISFKKNNGFGGYEFVVDGPSLIDNEFFYANFCGDTSNRNIMANDYPLTIRTYQKGDFYQIKNYKAQVRRLFIDWKMPTDVRKRWPLIVNKEGKIIYIPRYRKDFKPEKESNFYVKECFTLN